ncbi:MAG: LURP-one-related family protein [Mogibacterium sp.]|nr:LURP-one-related family protein [Mogibacterium sp.]MBR4091782.1 LURP-one-related family protein [Mogibacterium sp.]
MEVLTVLIVSLAVISILFRLTHQRYSGPGEAADIRNKETYGDPAKSLYTSSDVFTLHHRIEITDEAGNAVYRAETQFPSIHDKTDIYTADGRHVAYFERKLLTLHEIHYVDMDNGKSFTLSNELMHLIKDVTNIEGLGWVIDGNIIQLNFTIKDEKGKLLAVVSQKAISIHDKFAIDIYKPEYEEEIVALVITLQHMIRDRENSAAAGSGGSSAS